MKGFKPLTDLNKSLSDSIKFYPLYQPKPLKGIVLLNGFNETYTKNKEKENNNGYFI